MNPLRDERGVIVDWLARTVLVLALVGLVLFDGAHIARSAAKIGAAAAGMAAFVWGSWTLIEQSFDGRGRLQQLGLLLIPVVLGIGSYLSFAQLLGVEELDLVRGVLARRRSRAEG